MSDMPQRLVPEYKVTDYQKSLSWYIDLAGFSIDYDRPENEFAMLSREGIRLMIESLTDKSRVMKVGELMPPLGRGMHCQIEVSDAQTLHDNFVSHNWPLFSPMEERWYRADDVEVGQKQFWVQDPDGYLFRFFQDLGDRPVTVAHN